MMGKMQRFRQALRGLDRKILAIDEVFGADTIALVTKLVKGEITCDSQLHDHFGMNAEAVRERAEKFAAPTIIPAGPGKAVALVSVRGVAMYDMEFQPYCFSTMLLAQTLKGLANDPEIGTIVLDIDSPGGMVTGTPEAADALFAAKKKKNCIALVNPLCASAAYWIASQATEIVAIPSADVGSVGVFMLHIDMSGMMEMIGIKPTFIYAGKYKIEGNPYEPLGDEAKAHYQVEVDSTYQDFLNAVGRGRGIDAAVVEKKFGQGRTMSPQDAKRAGMIDKVATVDVVMRACGMQEMEHESRRRRGEAAETPQEAQAGKETVADKKQNKIVTELIVDARGVEAGTALAIRAYDAMRESADKAREAVERANAAAAQQNEGEPSATADDPETVNAPDDGTQSVTDTNPMHATINLTEGNIVDLNLDLELSGLDTDSEENSENALSDASEARRRKLRLLGA